jgi:hypothetical protein
MIRSRPFKKTGLSLCAPARKGLVMFTVQAGSKQLLIPTLRWTSAAFRSFGLLGGLCPNIRLVSTDIVL